MREMSRIVLAVFAMVLVSEVGLSESLHPETYTVNLRLNKEMKADGTYSDKYIFGGVSYNLSTKVAKLRVDSTFPCTPGMVCALGFVPVENVELPVVYDYTDNCGVEYVLARLDQMPVDGALNEMWIINRTNSVCDQVDESHMVTEVYLYSAFYNRMNGELVESRSQYVGVYTQEDPFLPTPMPEPFPSPIF